MILYRFPFTLPSRIWNDERNNEEEDKKDYKEEDKEVDGVKWDRIG